MARRSQYVAVTQLPPDDKTLRQAKAVIAYQHPGARNITAHWIDPSDHGHGVTVAWDDRQ